MREHYLRFLALILSLALMTVYIHEGEAGVGKNKNDRRKTLGFNAVNAFWPISGGTDPIADHDTLTSPFGPRNIGTDSKPNYDFHEGIDIRAVNLPVHGFADGKVDFKASQLDPDSGWWVRVKHTDPGDGSTFYTIYLHLTNDGFYTQLDIGDPIFGGSQFATSGSSGNVNPHLHFGGLVGGTSARDNAINPMREDSLPYINLFPVGIFITNTARSSFTFEIETFYDELDLNEVEVQALNDDGSIFDVMFMNFDTREGVDAKFHCPDQSCENGDEDGTVNGTTVNGNAIQYEIIPQVFNAPADQFDSPSNQIIKFRVTFPTQWLAVNRAKVLAIDTQGLTIEQTTDVVTGIFDAIAISGPGTISENQSATYTGTFFDSDGSGTFPAAAWTWEFKAQKSDGGFFLIQTDNTNSIPQSNGDWTTEWSFTVADLSTFGQTWSWVNDKVQGLIYAELLDSDGITHTDELFVLIDAAPETPTLTSIQESGGQVTLSWNAAGGATSYNVYRGTEAYFDIAGLTPLATTAQLTYTDNNNPVGDVTLNYYYVVTAVNSAGESGPSNRVGEADYQIGTQFSFVAIPFSGTGISDAVDLGQSVSSADAVYRMVGGTWELMAFNDGSGLGAHGF